MSASDRRKRTSQLPVSVSVSDLLSPDQIKAIADVHVLGRTMLHNAAKAIKKAGIVIGENPVTIHGHRFIPDPERKGEFIAILPVTEIRKGS